MSKVAYYIAGQCRNNPNARSHTYAYTTAGYYWPMCMYGWNRSNGRRFSIWRGSPGTEGDCKICQMAVRLRKRPVHKPTAHPTKWL